MHSAWGFISFFCGACARSRHFDRGLFSLGGVRRAWCKMGSQMIHVRILSEESRPQFFSLGRRATKGLLECAHYTCPGKVSANKNQPASGLWCRTFIHMRVRYQFPFFLIKKEPNWIQQNWAPLFHRAKRRLPPLHFFGSSNFFCQSLGWWAFEVTAKWRKRKQTKI